MTALEANRMLTRGLPREPGAGRGQRRRGGPGHLAGPAGQRPGTGGRDDHHQRLGRGRHGAVPPVAGSTEADARAALQGRASPTSPLRSRRPTTSPPGNVIDSNPTAGAEVAPDQTITARDLVRSRPGVGAPVEGLSEQNARTRSRAPAWSCRPATSPSPTRARTAGAQPEPPVRAAGQPGRHGQRRHRPLPRARGPAPRRHHRLTRPVVRSAGPARLVALTVRP